MKNTKQHTLGDEIIDQIRGTESIFTVAMIIDEDGCESAILKDNDCGDITIIQSYGEGIKTTFLDTNELNAIRRIIL